MGEVIRQRRVRAETHAALVAAAQKECDAQQAAPSCERVLVVYGAVDARIYIESSAATGNRASTRKHR